MRTSTKVLTVFNIIALLMFAVLFRSLISVVTFQPKFAVTMTAETIVALVFFAIWFVTGVVLFFRFLKHLSFSKKLFFITITSTGVYAAIVFGVYNINNFNNAPMVALSNYMQVANYANAVWIYIAIFTSLYLIFLAVVYFIISKPIRKIKITINKIVEGESKINYKISGSRDFEEIGSALHLIDKKIKEKDRFIQIAGDEYDKIIPKQFYKFLGKKNCLELRLGNVIKKEVVTLFCDIFKGNKNGEACPVEERLKFIKSYLDAFSPIVSRNNGFIEKYHKNGFLAIFVNANDAICASFEMNAAALAKKNKFAQEDAPMTIGISVHTSEIEFGTIEKEKHKIPKIITDVGMFTGKMQEINKVYGTSVVFSKRTLTLLKKEKYDYRYIGNLNLCASERKCEMFELLDVYPNPIKNKIKETNMLFEQAVRLFEDKKTAYAKKLFEEVLLLNKDDLPAKIYYGRCN